MILLYNCFCFTEEVKSIDISFIQELLMPIEILEERICGICTSFVKTCYCQYAQKLICNRIVLWQRALIRKSKHWKTPMFRIKRSTFLNGTTSKMIGFVSYYSILYSANNYMITILIFDVGPTRIEKKSPCLFYVEYLPTFVTFRSSCLKTRLKLCF